jgi:rhodanese-related sulfurtransferase
VRIVDYREVLRVIEAGGQVVDVLPEHEYRSVHIRGAIHLPLPQLLDRAERVLDKDRQIVVYCRDCL